MNNDRLYGFAFRSPQVATIAHTCPTLFADSRVIHIITEIAKDYADMFLWFCFSHMDEEAVSKEFAREQMTLFYDDKKGKNGGMEISFSLWQDDRLEVEMTAMTGHETGNDDDECFNNSWYLAMVTAEEIADDIMWLIDVYLKQDFMKLFNVVVNYGITQDELSGSFFEVTDE